VEKTRWSSQIRTVVRSFVVIVVWYFQTKYKKVADQKSVLSIAQTEIIEIEQAFLLL
jgi:hypothetical protein